MTRLLSAALLFALPLTLGACKKDKPKDAVASGEILPGSISDAMLPEDRVTSQPPLAPQTERTVRTAPSEAAADATAAAPEPAAPAEPAPAAEKLPE